MPRVFLAYIHLSTGQQGRIALGLARELAQQDIATAPGGAWTATAVRRVLARAGNAA